MSAGFPNFRFCRDIRYAESIGSRSRSRPQLAMPIGSAFRSHIYQRSHMLTDWDHLAMACCCCCCRLHFLVKLYYDMDTVCRFLLFRLLLFNRSILLLMSHYSCALQSLRSSPGCTKSHGWSLRSFALCRAPNTPAHFLTERLYY